MSVGSWTLKNVVRISASSILFSSLKGEALDFKTVSSAPAAHRDVLQNNGLVAKICIGLFMKSDEPEKQQQAEDFFYSPEGRLRLWSKCLMAGGLTIKEGDVVVPPHLACESWPLLSTSAYDNRIEYYRARKASHAAEQSPFCAPIISLNEYCVLEKGIEARVCVVWMPQYNCDAISWAESIIKSGRWVSEHKLTTVVRHVVSGLTLLHNILEENVTGRAIHHDSDVVDLKTDGLQQLRLLSNLELEDVLVHEDNNEVTFLLTVSPFSHPEKLWNVSRDTQHQKLQYYPFLAPEQVNAEKEAVLTSSAVACKWAMWALGVMLYAIASGQPSLQAQVKRFNKHKGIELPFNHPQITPDQILSRIRRDLEPGNYSAGLSSLIALLLSLDAATRPGFLTIEEMMTDLNRPMPVYRFPFAIGSFDLIHLPEPQHVQLNMRARKYISDDICCVCHKQRHMISCLYQNHAPAIASPSWRSDEPLPSIFLNNEVHASYLYPLLPPMEDHHARRLLHHSLIPFARGDAVWTNSGATRGNSEFIMSQTSIQAGKDNLNTLFQICGGFAIFNRESVPQEEGAKAVDRITMNAIIILYPRCGIQKSEAPWTPKQLHFTAALPWISQCTAALQRKGRILSPVPPIFGGVGSDAKYMAWLYPGEAFTLSDGRRWVPCKDGGFVFWFHDMLEPTDKDRFFALTSLRALTLSSRVPRTVLPEKIFRVDLGAECAAVYSRAPSERGIAAPCTNEDVSFPNSIHVPPSAFSSPASVRQSKESNIGLRSGVRQRCANHPRRPPMRVSVFNDQMTGIDYSPRIVQASEAQPKELGTSSSLPPTASPKSVEKTPEKKPLTGRSCQSCPFTTPRGLNPESLVSSPSYDGANGSPRSKTLPNDSKEPQGALKGINPNQVLSLAKKADGILFECSIEDTPVNSKFTVSDYSSQAAALQTSAISLRVFGCWYHPELFEVNAQGLTYYIPSTGEHGSCQTLVPIGENLKEALNPPLETTHVSFLSSDIPLLLVNHAQIKTRFSDSFLLPHHGLAFFNAHFTLVAVLGLRCSVSETSVSGKHEFLITYRNAGLVAGPCERFSAKYFSNSVEPLSVPINGPSGTTSRALRAQRRSAPTYVSAFVGKGDEKIGLSGAGPDNTHQCESAPSTGREVKVGTPQPSSTQSGWGEGERLRMSWIGFDAEESALVFSDNMQGPWRVFRITKAS